MQLKKLLSDDEGVSPVIGVILMVAITVILAAVIAAFVLGLGDSDDVAPQTTFEFDFDEDETFSDSELTITVTSGDTIDAENLVVESAATGELEDADYVDNGFDGEVSAGSSATIDGDGDITNNVGEDEGSLEGETVNVVWESDDGDDSSILASFDVPEDS